MIATNAKVDGYIRSVCFAWGFFVHVSIVCGSIGSVVWQILFWHATSAIDAVCTVYTVHEMEAFMGIANETWSAHTQLGNGRRRRRLPWQTCEQTKHHLQRLRNGRCVENAASRLNTFCCYFVLSTMTIPSQQWVNTIQYIFSHRRIRLCSGWWAENYVISMYDVEDKEYASFLRMLHQPKLRLLCRVHALTMRTSHGLTCKTTDWDNNNNEEE